MYLVLPVIEDISNANDEIEYPLLIVRELDTPAGYVKLQQVGKDVPCTSVHWNILCLEPYMDLFFQD